MPDFHSLAYLPTLACSVKVSRKLKDVDSLALVNVMSLSEISDKNLDTCLQSYDYHIRVFRSEPHSARSANIVLNVYQNLRIKL